MNGKYDGTVVDRYEAKPRTTYAVEFDDRPGAKIPPQTAIGVRAEELERL